MAGIDSLGFTIKRFPEVLADIEALERTNINPSIYTRDDELLGQLNNIVSLLHSEGWELSQAVNDNFNVLKAEGKNLDDLGTIVGVSRIGKSFSRSNFQLYVGNEGTTVPQGASISNIVTGDIFLVVEESTISSSSCIYSLFSIDTISDSTTYSLEVNGETYSYTSGVSATLGQILSGIKYEIDSDTGATWTASVQGNNLKVESSTTTEIIITSLTNLSVYKTASLVVTRAQVAGRRVAPANSVTKIVSAISGVDSTTNIVAYTSGRDAEGDEEFRARILRSQQTIGVATVPSIEATLRDVGGVTSAVVYENRTLITDSGGRPGKSFESVVQGGDDEEVAQTIYDIKPAGIETYGTTNSHEVLNSLGEVAQDSDGTPLLINFTRPSAINLAFKVTYDLYDEEVFPEDTGEEEIRETVVEFTNSQGVDKDIIPKRYFGNIYSNIQGVDSVVVEVQEISSQGDTPNPLSWQTTRLPIDFRSFGNTTGVDVYVEKV